jgi:phosphoribosylanthranilate isomerase
MMFEEPENRTKLKVCGITTLEDARFISGALADYIGFIFFDESPRYIDPAKAGAIINWLEGPEKVGVFVNQPLDDVNDISKQTGIDLVQLHGNESPGYCSLVEKPVIKVFHVDGQTDPDTLRQEVSTYKDVADFYLFDTKSNDQWGGTGQTFDWAKLADCTGEKPFFLSGGISSENVTDAIKMVDPYAIDLSSSLEESPGLKDFDKVEALFDVLREIWDRQEMGNFNS